MNNYNNYLTNENTYIRLHVFEPEESTNQQDWYKDLKTFSYTKCFDDNNYKFISIGDIIEDDMGTRFRILSRHWKFDTIEQKPVLEFTAERYIRRGKQNPYMI